MMGDLKLIFRYKSGDIVRIGMYKNGELHHEFHGMIESPIVKQLPGQSALPHYKIYSDERLYSEEVILGLVS